MNERQKKIMVPYEEKTDTCPDCSTTPCDCGLPAGYTPTPWTDANEEDGWNPCGWAVDSNLVRELERELTAARQELKAVTEQRDRLAEALKQIQGVGLVAVDAFDELDRIDEIAAEAIQSLNQAAVKGGNHES